MSAPADWSVFDSDPPVLTYRYSLGPAISNALAVGVNGGLMVFSPPYRAPASAFESLAQYGKVRALVASNAYHHMGIPEWKARFPEAEVFAPAQAIARVQKKSGIEGIKPLAAAASIAGERVELVDMPHYRTGETLVRIRSSRGLAWYVADIMLHVREMPRNPALKFLMFITRSAPGLLWNKVGPKLVMVDDYKAVQRWLREQYRASPPRWIIPTHGDVLDCEAERKTVDEFFDNV